MPNWCLNEVIVIGPPARVDEFIATAQADDTKFSLTNLAPISGDAPDTLEARVASWGTKWDVDCDEVAVYDIDGARHARYIFDSAWSPPVGAYQTMSESWSDLAFVTTGYEGNNGYAGHASFIGGEILGDWEPERAHIITTLLVDSDLNLYRTYNGEAVASTNDALKEQLQPYAADPHLVLVDATTGERLQPSTIDRGQLDDFVVGDVALSLKPTPRFLWVHASLEPYELSWEVTAHQDSILPAAVDVLTSKGLEPAEVLYVLFMGVSDGEEPGEGELQGVLDAGVDPLAATQLLSALISNHEVLSPEDIITALHGALRQE